MVRVLAQYRYGGIQKSLVNPFSETAYPIDLSLFACGRKKLDNPMIETILAGHQRLPAAHHQMPTVVGLPFAASAIVTLNLL